MKKIFTILLLTACLVIAKDTTLVQTKDTLVNKYAKDVLMIKTINQETFWDVRLYQTLVSVVIGALLTLFGVFLANKYQKKIAQANIKAETKRQWLEKVRQYSAIYNQHMYESHIFFRPFIDKKFSLYTTITQKDKDRFKDKIDLISMSVFNLGVYLSSKNETQNNLLKEIEDLKQILINYFVLYDNNVSSLQLVDDALIIINKSFEIRDKIRVLIADEEKHIETLLTKERKIFNWFKKTWKEVGEYKP